VGGTLAAAPVAAARSVDGRINVFARGTDDVLYRTVQEGAGWSAWAPLGTGIVGAPDVRANVDGRLEVFARGAGNQIWHAWESTPGGSWTGWSSLLGTFGGDPAVLSDEFGTGRLIVFARGVDGTLFHIWQDPPGRGWSNWTGPGGPILSDPAPALNADNRLEVFTRGTDNAAWHRWQTAPANGWGDWTSLGNEILGNPAAMRDATGRLHVFARGSDGALWQRYQHPPGVAWAPWRSLGGAFAGDPQVLRDGAGMLHVAIAGAGGELWSVRQNSVAPADFGAFTSLGRAVPPPPPPAPAPATPTPVPTVTPGPRLRTISVTISYSHRSSRRSTRFSRLQVKGVPRGATVRVTCAKGCSRKSYVKRNARGTVSIRAVAGKALRVGTRIRVEVTAPNMIGAVKTLTVRSRNDPSIATRCLPPGARRDSAC
jgi:hypothetical protein